MGFWQSLLRWFKPAQPPAPANAAADERIEPAVVAVDPPPAEQMPPQMQQPELPFDSSPPIQVPAVEGSAWGSARQQQMLALYCGIA